MSSSESAVDLKCGNSVDLMNHMKRESQRFSLIFCDPPFNIGEKYEGFTDKMDPQDYADFVGTFTLRAWRLIKPGGVLALHGSIKLLPVYFEVATALGINKAFENHIVWHYRFGQCGYTNFIGSHCNCLIFRKPGERKWYPDSILVPSDRAVKYNDKRATQGERSGKRPPGTVWGVPSDGAGWGRVTGNSKERWPGHPNQLPCRYLSRIVRAYTKPGDWVLDPFMGSGTTGLVCDREGRNFSGIDISEKSVASARERIATGYYPPELLTTQVAPMSAGKE